MNVVILVVFINFTQIFYAKHIVSKKICIQKYDLEYFSKNHDPYNISIDSRVQPRVEFAKNVIP